MKKPYCVVTITGCKKRFQTFDEAYSFLLSLVYLEKDRLTKKLIELFVTIGDTFVVSYGFYEVQIYADVVE